MNVSYIIQAQNEEVTVGRVIAEIKKTNPYEIIVVVNGSTDKTSDIVRSLGCTLLYYKEPLGINVGKAIGAFYAKGDILIFLDGDIVIPSKDLLRLSQSIKDGHDIALNDLTWVLKRVKKLDPTSVAKITLNLFLQRGELGMNALGAIPNALSRRAVKKIGWWNVIDPPLAQTIGILHHLSISAPASPNVISTNKIRPQHRTVAKNSPYAKSTSRIIGDHLQAIHYLIQEKGVRGGYPDNGLRSLPKIDERIKREKNAKRSAVVSLTLQTNELSKLLDTLKKASVDEIIVVGTIDKQMRSSLQEKVTKVVSISQDCRSCASRAVGAMHCSGEAILFVDGHQQLGLTDILPFYEAVENRVDVAVHNENERLKDRYPLNAKMIVQNFLNIAVKKPRLQSHSLVSVPHALHRRVIEKIGAESLMIPPLAYLKAILENVSIRAVQLKLKQQMDSLAIFFGDHIEAIHYYLQTTNERGRFTDGGKNREILEEIKKWGFKNESI
ncbi:MAG TPA: glycosyltransferase [Bacilli bacterium]|nr:glycosyltransferase [Bacilli bacterium]